jgi:hypothetical protein
MFLITPIFPSCFLCFLVSYFSPSWYTPLPHHRWGEMYFPRDKPGRCERKRKKKMEKENIGKWI